MEETTVNNGAARKMSKSKGGAIRNIIQPGRMDMTFFVMVIALLAVGLVCLFSSSYAYALQNYGDSMHFIKRQIIFAVLGVAAMLVFSKIRYQIYKKFAWVIYAASLIMLIVVLILPPLQEGFNYKRWLAIGGFSFQPSEIAKFAIILLFSTLISKNIKYMKKARFGVLTFLVLLIPVVGLVVVEPHLSATLLIFAIAVSLVIVGGVKLGYIVGALIAGVGLGGVAILSGVVGYGSSRIQSWINPWGDVSGDGWQTIQSLLSIGSGGMFGAGLGESRQKYLWVPEPQNDFIFSIVCEELGFVGAMAIIILFALLIWRGFQIATKSKNKFGSLMAFGLTIQVGIQAALNIMVVTNTVPNTGISLPFFSYGGTALIMLLSQMGMILAISRDCKVAKA